MEEATEEEKQLYTIAKLTYRYLKIIQTRQTRQLYTISQLTYIYLKDIQKKKIITDAKNLIILSAAAAIYIETQRYYVFCFKTKNDVDYTPIQLKYFINEGHEDNFFKNFPEQKPQYDILLYNSHIDKIKEIAVQIATPPIATPPIATPPIATLPIATLPIEGFEYMVKTNVNNIGLIEDEKIKKKGIDIFSYYIFSEEELFNNMSGSINAICRTKSTKIHANIISKIKWND